MEDKRSSGRPFKKKKKKNYVHQRDETGPVHPSLFRNELSGRLSVKKTFLMKGNREERLRHAKLHKNWTENPLKHV